MSNEGKLIEFVHSEICSVNQSAFSLIFYYPISCLGFSHGLNVSPAWMHLLANGKSSFYFCKGLSEVTHHSKPATKKGVTCVRTVFYCCAQHSKEWKRGVLPPSDDGEKEVWQLWAASQSLIIMIISIVLCNHRSACTSLDPPSLAHIIYMSPGYNA